MHFEKYLQVLHKTRWLLIPLLIYIFGEWIEGPPTRVMVHSNIFLLTIVSLSVYVSIYLVLKFPNYIKSILFSNILISSIFIVFVRYRYNGAVVEGTDMIFIFMLSVILLQILIWLRSLI